MSNETMRKEFEAHHRVPEEAFYKERVGAYKYEQHPTVDHPVNELWESFCDGWQAARAQSEEPVACGRCGGAGCEGYHDHGSGTHGEEAVERIRCERCEGFGTHPPAREQSLKSEIEELAHERDVWKTQAHEYQSAYKQAREQVPSGWKLVPVEPTTEMLRRGTWSGNGGISVSEEWACKVVYQRMLAAAPQPPAQGWTPCNADTERLNWLDQRREDCAQEGPYGEPELYAHAWGIYEQADSIREAIDMNMQSPEPPEE